MKNKAFTLIELLVVVAIIGILAAVGVVAYNGYTESAKKKVTMAMSTYFRSTLKNAYNSNIPSTFYGRYQGTCVASSSQPSTWEGLNEQGVHHVAMGWENNRIILYVDTCVESSGVAESKIYYVK